MFFDNFICICDIFWWHASLYLLLSSSHAHLLLINFHPFSCLWFCYVTHWIWTGPVMCAWLWSNLLGPEYFISGYISENIYYLFFVLVFFVFCFESLFLPSPNRKSFPVQRSPNPAHSLLSSSLYLTLYESLIHLELSFVQGNNFGSIWILLHAAVCFDQHHLLEMLSVSQCVFLASL